MYVMYERVSSSREGNRRGSRDGTKGRSTKGQPTKRSRQAVSKRSHNSVSKGEPIPKKARRESEAETSMPKVVLSGVEVQG